MERAFKGIWIPKEVWLSKDLSLQEKVFLVEIDSLDNENGCFASNKYFAEFFDLSKGRCSQVINNLEEKGYIKIEYVYEDDRTISKRIIRVVNKLNTPIKKVKGGSKFPKPPYLENDKDNNTLINNTINNPYSNEFEQFWSFYPRKVDKKKAYKSFKTCIKSNTLEVILDGTKKYAEQVKSTDKQFIKHPSTFLNNESFIDGYEDVEQPKQVVQQKEETPSVLAGIWGD